MSKKSYLIDTNILIGLEDNHTVKSAYATFYRLTLTYNISVFVHEAAKEDILRDKNSERRAISLSKIKKYRILNKRHGLTKADLAANYGPLNRPNDIVDATLLQALESGVTDFLVSQDKGLHERAQKRCAELGRRVLFVGDATDLLIQTYDSKKVPIRHVKEVGAHEIDHTDSFFDSLRKGYPKFDDWWRDKCVKQHRPCWVVYDDDTLAGLIVRKDEAASDTDAVSPEEKILKICTFKVLPEMKGVKLGELLLRKVLWFAQTNGYNLAYLTAYAGQAALMSLLELYGFVNVGRNANGEFIYERIFESGALVRDGKNTPFTLACKNYPRFLLDDETQGFVIPIREEYHDKLYPDLRNPLQPDLFPEPPTRPGNTMRKVYLCRARSNLGDPGSILFFYKSASQDPPSQAMTALGILENVTLARSTSDLMLLTGGRSVYSKEDLDAWESSDEHPVKVINYLLVAYIDPPISRDDLQNMGVVDRHPQQSIYKLPDDRLHELVTRSNLAFKV